MADTVVTHVSSVPHAPKLSHNPTKSLPTQMQFPSRDKHCCHESPSIPQGTMYAAMMTVCQIEGCHGGLPHCLKMHKKLNFGKTLNQEPHFREATQSVLLGRNITRFPCRDSSYRKIWMFPFLSAQMTGVFPQLLCGSICPQNQLQNSITNW